MVEAAGKKVRLNIVPCKTDGGTLQAEKSPQFEVQLNPSGYKHNLAINYDATTPPGATGQEVKFNAVGGDKVNFNFIVDGTGVVQPAGSVVDRIDTLRQVVYKYQGKKHEPNVVRILWGSFIFYGRLESMGLDYTLFKPSGEPLRAKIDLAFIGTMGSQEEARQANRSSPDMTHVVTVQSGDTLPALCHRIYGDSRYYTAVADYNGLTNFRRLQPGQQLVFPSVR